MKSTIKGLRDSILVHKFDVLALLEATNCGLDSVDISK